MKKFTPQTRLKEVLENPRTHPVLLKYRFPCLTCPFARFELERLTLEQVCKTYGIDLEKLLIDLNQTNGKENKG